MIHGSTLLTVVLMASMTFLTRIGGYVALRNRTLGPRMSAVMEAAPGCVLITLIAPAALSGRVADAVALAVTIVAAARLPMLPTVLIAVAATGCLRHLLG